MSTEAKTGAYERYKYNCHFTITVLLAL